MGVGSYLEVYTMLFGWLLYDNVWSILSETGIAYIPFFVVVIKNFAEPYKSQEAKDAASVSQRRMELDIIAMFIVIIIAVVPSMNLSVGAQSYKEACSTAPVVSGGATGTTYDTTFTTVALGGSVAQVPIWWYMVMNLSGAINDSVIAGMSCSVNIRQVQYEINNIQITDQGLKDDLARFQNECYLESLATFAEDPNSWQATFNAGTYDVDDMEWIGSKFFQDNVAFYAATRAVTPVTNFAFNATRDNEYDASVATPANGRPTCKNWWTDSTNGLLVRLNTQVPASKNASLGAFGALFGNSLAKERENALKTVLLNSSVTIDGLERMTLAGLESRDSGGYTATVDRFIGTTGKTVVGGVTTGVAWAFVATTLITIQNMMPNLQALILMTIYFLLPFIMVMSGYSWGMVITATFVVFSLKFLTTIYAVLILLETMLFGAVNQFSLNNISNSLATSSIGGGVIDLSVAAMWIIMPAMWIGMLAWAGIKAGSAISSGGGEAKKTGDKGTDQTNNVTKTAVKGK